MHNGWVPVAFVGKNGYTVNIKTWGTKKEQEGFGKVCGLLWIFGRGSDVELIDFIPEMWYAIDTKLHCHSACLNVSDTVGTNGNYAISIES